jgi:putative FmdB family regulatory protein
MRVFDYKCQSGHVSEHFVKDANVNSVLCPTCGANAERQIPAPQPKLEGLTGAFPGAASAWERKRYERMKYERKTDRDRLS